MSQEDQPRGRANGLRASSIKSPGDEFWEAASVGMLMVRKAATTLDELYAPDRTADDRHPAILMTSQRSEWSLRPEVLAEHEVA